MIQNPTRRPNQINRTSGKESTFWKASKKSILKVVSVHSFGLNFHIVEAVNDDDLEGDTQNI